MKTRVIAAIIALLVIGAAALVWEPRQNGHPLQYWLHQYWFSSEQEQKLKKEAEGAIRAIGATKAVPELLRLVRTKNGPIRRWLEQNGERYHLRFVQPPPVDELHLDGITGFEVLGTNAAFATGRLTELLKDEELAFMAVRCLSYLGKAAEPALCQCLTNGDSSVREWAISSLASVTESVELYVDRIKPLLNDTNENVRCSALEAIGVQTEAPELAVPLLLQSLQSNDREFAKVGANALGNFGTNAASALPRLVVLAQEGAENPARAALAAIAKIDSTGSVAILSNTIVTGNPNLMYTAVSELRTITPELALRLLIDQLRSPDKARRSSAIGTAGGYEATTPGLAPALKAAAKDDDPELARRATFTMRCIARKEREKNGTRVEIATEPRYEGKSLGEWLEMRRREGGLSTNAVKALQHMGTNVVPALLARLDYHDPMFELPDEEVSIGAVFGFMALKEGAVLALPELRKLMDSDNDGLALRAMIATVGADEQAVGCILEGLTNRHGTVRSEAANLLTSEWAAKYPKLRQSGVPLVAKLLDDAEENVRATATNTIHALDPKLAKKLGVASQPSVYTVPGN